LIAALGILLMGAAAGAAAATPKGGVSDTSVVFQLPLAGEVVQPTGTGILVQVGPKAAAVDIFCRGSRNFRLSGESQGYGYFSARTEQLPVGRWSLEVVAKDSAGNILVRRSIEFYAGSMAKAQAAERAKVKQSLYVSLSGGYREGASEGTLRELATLERGKDGLTTTDSWTTLDRNASYSGLLQYDLQRDQFRLRTRASSDLAETWGHANSPTRLGVDLFWGPWAEAHIGDQNPAWSQFLMDGSRIRGLGVGLAVPKGSEPFVKLDAVVGEIQSGIDAQVRDFGDRKDTVPAQWARNVQAAQLSIGTASPLSWSLTVAHAIDDTTGVDMALHDSLNGQSPRENLAMGSELLARFLGGRLELYTQGALGLTTEDLRQGEDGNTGLPDFTSGLFTVNLSTRGSERVREKGDDPAGFVEDNLAVRTGVRTQIPLGRAGNSRVDLRWVRVGPQFESFTRTTTETSRSAVEWNTSTSLARDRLLVLVSGSAGVQYRLGLADVSQNSHSGAIHWLPAAGGVDLHLQSGRTASGGGEEARLETWNAGTGASGYLKRGDGHVVWRLDYSYLSSQASDGTYAASTSPVAQSFRNEMGQHLLDGALQWRPAKDLELRGSYQFGQFSYLATLMPRSTDFSHRGGGGLSVWTLRRKLMFSLDAGLAYTDGVQDIQFQSWDQIGRIQWEFVPDQILRFSERTASLVADDDLRLDLQWEAWF